MDALHQTFWYWHRQILSWPIVVTVLLVFLVLRGRQYKRLELPVRSLLLRQGALMGLLWLGFQVLHQVVRHNSRNFFCCYTGGCSCLTEHVWMLVIAFSLAFWMFTPSDQHKPPVEVELSESSPRELTASTEASG